MAPAELSPVPSVGRGRGVRVGAPGGAARSAAAGRSGRAGLAGRRGADGRAGAARVPCRRCRPRGSSASGPCRRPGSSRARTVMSVSPSVTVSGPARSVRIVSSRNRAPSISSMRTSKACPEACPEASPEPSAPSAGRTVIAMSTGRSPSSTSSARSPGVAMKVGDSVGPSGRSIVASSTNRSAAEPGAVHATARDTRTARARREGIGRVMGVVAVE